MNVVSDTSIKLMFNTFAKYITTIRNKIYIAIITIDILKLTVFKLQIQAKNVFKKSLGYFSISDSNLSLSSHNLIVRHTGTF